jgi:TonB family protein
MKTPRIINFVLIAFALALVSAPTPALAQRPEAQKPTATQSASAADTEIERGRRLYEQGDMKGAAKEFRAAVKRRKDDPVAWLYLGQTLIWRGEMKEARKALDASLRLKPDSADAHASVAYLLMLSGKPREAEAEAKRALEFNAKQIDARFVVGTLRLHEGAWLKALEEADAILKVNEHAASAYSLRTQALIGLYERGNTILSDARRGVYNFNSQTVEEVRAAQPLRLKEAADSLEKYLQLSPNAADAAELREQVEALRFYAETDPARRAYATSEVTQRAVINFKPEPSFTEEARNANVTGVVRLRAVLASDGQVRHIVVLKGLSYGLTERAMAAARKIKFTPATVNGNPVSQYVVLEYNFNIY